MNTSKMSKQDTKKELDLLGGPGEYDELNDVLHKMMTVTAKNSDKYYNPVEQSFQGDSNQQFELEDEGPKRVKNEFGSTKDISERDRAHLMRSGFDEILKNPTSNIVSQSISKEKLDLGAEARDSMQASNITFSFVGFRPSKSHNGPLPSKFYFRMRFFTFSEVITDMKSLELDEDEASKPFISQPDEPNKIFFLKNENRARLDSFKQLKMYKRELVNINFKIDPSQSQIADEHIRLAQYLKERRLTIEVFNGDTHFYYGSCQVPLYELCR